jgi:uncharacterized protein (TIGR04255 family)
MTINSTKTLKNYMKTKKPQFHYPTEIKLKNNSLIEAWLEIRWQLKETEVPGFLVDSQYPFALGIFFESVKDTFGFVEELPAVKAPEGFLPYAVQHRFRVAKDGWPILQLGPGVASVNFTTPYSWTLFKEKAHFLRSKLINAYKTSGLKTQGIFLRYRNGFPYNYSKESLLIFLDEKLNTSISLPKFIPGSFIEKPIPSNSNILFTYDLSIPKGIGKIQIGSGYTRKTSVENESKPNEVIIVELEVGSIGNDAPDITVESKFTDWLELAHSVTHEWFFSLIDGELFKQFSEGE